MGHGKNFAPCVVQSGGVAMATITAATIPAHMVRILAAATLPSPMALRSIPFSRNSSVTKANDTPAKKMNSGAGSVPPSFDHPVNDDDFFASGLIHES